MSYALVVNGAVEKYPYTLRDFKKDNPNISPPNSMQALKSYGIEPVEKTPRPATTETERVSPGPVVFTEGAWRTSWVVEDIPQAEIDASKDAQALNAADQLAFKLIFRLNNEIRDAKGQQPLTPQQFRQFVRAQL